MIRNIELLLKNVGKLDISSKVLNTFGLEINYNIDDITDISSRKSNYTKSFEIIGTPNNNKYFKHIYDINFTSKTFDLNKRQECVLSINNNIIMDGYLKLRSIYKKYISGKYQIIYDVIIYDVVKDIFAKFGDKKLRDLDFSSQFTYKSTEYNIGNHEFNISNIVNSQNTSNSIENVYEYCVINWNYDGENQGDSFPNSDLDISMFYPSLYLRAIIDKMFIDIGYTYESRLFNGDIYSGSFLKLATIYNGNDMMTYANYYSAELENTTTYTSTTSGTTYQQIELEKNYQMEKSYNSGGVIIRGDGNYQIDIDYNVGLSSEIIKLVIMNNGEELLEIPSGNTSYTYNGDFKKNDYLTFEIKFESITNLEVINYSVDIAIPYDNINDKLNTEINISDYLPDVTQAEFLKGIIKQFNLYLYSDKYNERNIYIDPRDNFYGRGDILNWSDKLDNNVSIIEPMSKKIKRYYNFKMPKIDTIKTNIYYDKWQSDYGNKEINVDNNDIIGTNDIVGLFGGYDYKYYSTQNDYLFIPNFVKDISDSVATNKRETPPVIGYVKKHETSPYVWKLINYNNNILNWNTINHVEKFGNDKYDLNFETKQGTNTYNNSYDNYYSKGLNNLFNNNNRIITQYINLDISDIQKIDLKNPILINRELYYLQNIVSDISSNSTSKVEMIKAFDYNKTIIPEQHPVIWNTFYLGSTPLPPGAGRPTATVALLDTGVKLIHVNGDIDIKLSINGTYYYMWFAVPIVSNKSKKNYWEITSDNKGNIGGNVNLGGNLFPDPTIVDYYGVDYYVYIQVYQSGTNGRQKILLKNTI